MVCLLVALGRWPTPPTGLKRTHVVDVLGRCGGGGGGGDDGGRAAVCHVFVVSR